jgi:hypothetical protein
LVGLLGAGVGLAARPNPRQETYLPQNAHAAWPLTVTFGRIPHGDAAAAPIENALR